MRICKGEREGTVAGPAAQKASNSERDHPVGAPPLHLRGGGPRGRAAVLAGEGRSDPGRRNWDQ
jgi:hypothetical protein